MQNNSTKSERAPCRCHEEKAKPNPYIKKVSTVLTKLDSRLVFHPVDKLPWKSFCTTAKTGFPHDGLASGTASVTLTYNSLHSVIFLRGFQRATLGEFSILITYVNRTYDLVRSGWEKWSLGFSIDTYKMLFAMYRKDFYVAENNKNN